MATATNAALQQDVETLQEEAEKLQNELEDVLNQFDSVQQEADCIEQEVVDEVRTSLGCPRFCNRCFASFPTSNSENCTSL